MGPGDRERRTARDYRQQALRAQACAGHPGVLLSPCRVCKIRCLMCSTLPLRWSSCGELLRSTLSHRWPHSLVLCSLMVDRNLCDQGLALLLFVRVLCVLVSLFRLCISRAHVSPCGLRQLHLWERCAIVGLRGRFWHCNLCSCEKCHGGFRGAVHASRITQLSTLDLPPDGAESSWHCPHPPSPCFWSSLPLVGVTPSVSCGRLLPVWGWRVWFSGQVCVTLPVPWACSAYHGSLCWRNSSPWGAAWRLTPVHLDFVRDGVPPAVRGGVRPITGLTDKTQGVAELWTTASIAWWPRSGRLAVFDVADVDLEERGR